MKPLRVLMLVCLLGALVATAAAQDTAAREVEARQKLAEVRAQIRALTADQRRLDAQRNTVAAELRAADEALAAAAHAERELQAAVDAQQAELERLQQRARDLDAELDAARGELALLLRSAYALGRHEQLKLLLAPADGGRVGRALAYQRYFKQARMRRIEALLGQLAALAELSNAVAAQQQRLATARDEQRAAHTALQAERDRQRVLVARLDGRYADARSRLAALGRDETALLKLIESLKDVFADIPRQLGADAPLAQQRGQLPRPASGRLLSAFGGRLPDGRASSGWWIAAAAGSPVQAVAHGRVAFADWLQGYGLLLILDHGDGFMSLYASNEALMKEPGDWVAAGATIATVGSSGGQPQPGLYFELRRNGRPIDPQPWLRR